MRPSRATARRWRLGARGWARSQAKAIYKDRAASAECVNAQARNRGLIRLPVRGTAKVKCVVLLHALAHNLMRMAALAPQLLGIGTGTSSAGSVGLSSGQFA